MLAYCLPASAVIKRLAACAGGRVGVANLGGSGGGEGASIASDTLPTVRLLTNTWSRRLQYCTQAGVHWQEVKGM